MKRWWLASSNAVDCVQQTFCASTASLLRARAIAQAIRRLVEIGLRRRISNNGIVAAMDDHTFTIEKDEVGLGYCVIVQWLDGRRECVTGFGDQDQAKQWIRLDRMAARHPEERQMK